RVTTYIAAMRDVMAEIGLTLPEERIIHRPYTVAEGREGFLQMARRGSLPTAIVCSNDTLAFGVVYEALAQGFSVPVGISVTGLGDQEFAAHMTRPLTTISVPKLAMGRIAAEYLLGQVEGEPYELPRELPVQLVVRGTTGAPRRTPTVVLQGTK